MNKIEDRIIPISAARRRAFTGIALAFGGLIAGSKLWGRPTLQAMKETPSIVPIQKRTSLHEEIELNADPARICEALLESKKFAAFTDAPATIDSNPGGSFSLFGGLIVGRNIEIVPGQRIVQAWRPTHWEPGVYSIVRFEMKPNVGLTTVILNHTGFPEGEFDHLESGWHLHYFEPLKKFFA